MRKLIAIPAIMFALFILASCDIIEEEIERAESIKLEDFRVLLHEQSILLKITSNADEQVIENVIINDQEHDLIAQGDDWYLLEDVPVEKEYFIGDVNYKTGVGVNLSFNVDHEFDIEEGLNRAPGELVNTIDSETLIGEYTFSPSEEHLINIESEQDFSKETLDDWVWLIIEADTPIFVVLEYNDTLYVIEAPEETDDYIDND